VSTSQNQHEHEGEADPEAVPAAVCPRSKCVAVSAVPESKASPCSISPTVMCAAELGVTEAEVVADDVTRCQQLAADASDAGFDGLLAPSAALVGETTLAVFASAMSKVASERSRVQRPPVRMIGPDAHSTARRSHRHGGPAVRSACSARSASQGPVARQTQSGRAWVTRLPD
jgi:hypothetical protein